MNYHKLYDNIVIKAKQSNRNKEEGVYEQHHIKPKSLFPDLSKDPDNLVLLTPREHYICHWLLTKIHPGKAMNYAFLVMCNQAAYQSERDYKISSRVYDRLKTYFKYNNPAKCEKARAKISKAKKKEKHHFYGVPAEQMPNYKAEKITLIHQDGGVFVGTRNEAYTTLPLTPAQVSNLITGYRYTCKGWSLPGVSKPIYRGVNSFAADKTFYQFHNRNTGFGYVTSRQDFKQLVPFSDKSVNHLIYGSRNSLFGWVMTKIEET